MNARDRAGARYALHGYRRDLALVLGYGMRVAPRRMRAKSAGRRVVRRWDQGGDGVGLVRRARAAVSAGAGAATRRLEGSRRHAMNRRSTGAVRLAGRAVADAPFAIGAGRRVMLEDRHGSTLGRAGAAAALVRRVRGHARAELRVMPGRTSGSVGRRFGIRRSGESGAAGDFVVSRDLMRAAAGSRRSDRFGAWLGARVRRAKVSARAGSDVMRRPVAPVGQGNRSGDLAVGHDAVMTRVAGREAFSARSKPSPWAKLDDRLSKPAGQNAVAGRDGTLHRRDSQASVPDYHGAMMGGTRDVALSVGSLFTDEARRPPSGVTGFDGRLSPFFAGRKPGF